MDDEFRHMMTRVMAAGLAIAGIGTLLLFLMFRAFGEAHRGGRKHITLMVIVLSFVFMSIGLILYFT